MIGQEIVGAMEKGLKDAGVDGRITGVDMTTRVDSMPLTGMGGMILDRVVTGTEVTMVITLSLRGITLAKPGPTFNEMEFEIRPRAIAKQGEDI